MAAKLPRCRATHTATGNVITHLKTTGGRAGTTGKAGRFFLAGPVIISGRHHVPRAFAPRNSRGFISPHLPVAAAAIRRRRPIQSVARPRACINSRTGRATRYGQGSQLRHLIIAHSLLVDADVISVSHRLTA